MDTILRQPAGILIALAAAALLQAGCSSTDSPPYYSARVTNVYKEEVSLDHFCLLYSWEERGETPFLKPYTLRSKELIVEVMRPLGNDPGRVAVMTERIAFDVIESIDIELTETGKRIRVVTTDGRTVLAATQFPAALKRDPAAGLAEGRIFVLGRHAAGAEKEDFKLELNYIKKISGVRRTDR